MNKHGFTLIELLAVITVMALVMLLIVPGLNNLSNSNKEKEYKTYEDMMVEYAKTIPYSKYISNKYICLKDLGLENVNSNTTCNGYVEKSGNTFKPYISCSNNGKNIYTTNGYNLPSGC